MQKELNSILYGFQHWFFIDLKVIWEVFFHDFWSAFRVSSKRERSHSFSNIFQRFSYFVAIAKSLKSIIKMGGFWTMDFVIYIMRWSKTSSKNHIKNDLYWTRHRSEPLLDVKKSFSGRPYKIILFLGPFRGARSWGNRGGMAVIPGVWAPLIH